MRLVRQAKKITSSYAMGPCLSHCPPPPHNLTKSNPAQHNPNHYPFGNLMMSADCCGRATQNGSDSFTRCTRVSTGSRRRKSGTPRTFPSYFCAQMTAKCNNEKLFLCQLDEYEIFHKKKKEKRLNKIKDERQRNGLSLGGRAVS